MPGRPNYVELFDDRPSTCEALIALVKSCGLDVREERSDLRFAKAIRVLENMNAAEAEAAAPNGYIVDNHIEGMSTLVAFGKHDIATDDGANAGWRVTAEILLPKMSLVEIPLRPIAMLSGQSLEGVEAEYYNRFGNLGLSNVYFINKNDIANGNDIVAGFVEAVSLHKPKITGEAGNLRALVKMFEISIDRLGLSNSDIESLYRLNANMVNEPVATRFMASTTDDWQVKTKLLFRIASALSDSFVKAKDKAARDREIRKYIKRAEPALHNQTIHSLLLSGSEGALETVIDFLLNPTDFI